MTYLVYETDDAGREIAESLRIFRRRWLAERYAATRNATLYEEPGDLPPFADDPLKETLCR